MSAPSFNRPSVQAAAVDHHHFDVPTGTGRSSKTKLHTSRLSPPNSQTWVDPISLPNYGDASTIGGNAPDFIKQLANNTFGAYAVGDEGCFGYSVGKDVRFVEVNIERCAQKQGGMESTTIAEVAVTKKMLNGAGMLHGGCLAYLIDNCCSTPTLVIGLIQNVNGVGVTQAMNIVYHSPAPPNVPTDNKHFDDARKKSNDFSMRGR